MDPTMSRITRIVSITLLAFITGCAQQTTFPTPDAAAQSLVVAARANDRAALKRIFGSESDKLLSSGDEVADRNAAERFVELFDQKHLLVTTENASDSMTLVVGDNAWPFPVPVVKNHKNLWMFDTEVGIDEIINRRIGRNELDAIQVCLATVDAQREYAIADPDGDGIPEYAQKFLSDAGKKNGLYWKTGPDQPPSPLGELVADAAEQGYSASASGQRRPYHGYLYKILSEQGPHAPGGAYNYMVNGHMIGGFAVVAEPAEYGNSGIVTFIVNQSGVVYQKDLGDDTAKVAASITRFDPGPGWTKVQ